MIQSHSIDRPETIHRTWTPRSRITKKRFKLWSGSAKPTSTLWVRAILMLTSLVIALGGVAYAASIYQRDVFDETTTRFEAEVSSVVDLVVGLRSIDVPMGSVFYGFGSPEELEGHLRTFEQRSKAIDEAFRRAEKTLPIRGGKDSLRSARLAWEKTADDVVRARSLWGTSVVTDELAAGKDPFSEAWQRLRDAQASLTELTSQSLQELNARRTSASQVQRLISPIVLLTLALTLAIGAWSARRLSRRIVRPLISLRDAALRMENGDLGTRIAIQRTSSEIQELAGAMNELASSLQVSHGMLHDQAMTDSLTGLANRKAITDHLLQRFETDPDGLALLFVDLDDFKTVNDSLGHAAGDELLRIIASRITSSARGGEMVARLGGDEFAIVVETGGEQAVAVAVAERMLKSLSEPITVQSKSLIASCSIGIALGGHGGSSADELVRNADIAMYMAKGRGKNCFETFADNMHTDMLSRMSLKQDLSYAVERGQLVLEYQPVVKVDSLAVIGWEALLRWQHPERGLMSPADFISIAEDTGDIVPIGKWVIDRACEDFKQVLQGRTEPGGWISVNIAPLQLVKPNLVGTVRDALRLHQLHPQSLVLEITEGALVTDTESATQTLEELRHEGVRVAVDDFGTGFSNLRYLKDLPVDMIKIDRSFVNDLQGPGASMLEAIIRLGETLNLDTVAEGIEEEDQLIRLQGFGKLSGQGYHIARPMALSVAAAFTHLRQRVL